LLDTARRIETGAPPLRKLRPDLPRALAACVERALAVEPERRPSAAALAARLRQATATGRVARVAHRRRLRVRVHRSPLALKALPAVAAGLFAGFVAATVPFFPSGWAPALALLAALLSLASERAGLAFALAVPILPLGNYSLGLAIAYALLAVVWLGLNWDEPRTGLFLTLGPLLAPLGALGVLPIVGQVVTNPARRALQVSAAVLAAAAAATLAHLSSLQIAASERPFEAASVVGGALLADREVAVEAIALAAAAVILPLARGRGPWAAAGFVGAVLSLLLVLAPGLWVLPTAAAICLTGAVLALEPYVERRRLARTQPAAPAEHEPAEETAPLTRQPAPTRNVVGGG
jgi:hypothetical protein